MIHTKRYIFTRLFALIVFGLSIQPLLADAQMFSGAGGSSGGCKSECSNSTCQLQTGADGTLQERCPSGTRYDVDPNCIMNQNAQQSSCMDTMPVGSIKRVSETNCYRANGAGSNSKPRNHLGTDYSATEGTVVTAAADGNIVYAANLSGGGRAIMIEHEKKCQCTAGSQNSGCDTNFITVYLHLKAYLKTSGSVKRGEAIGLVGGSNYSGGVLCDYGESKGNCHPYGPHLHFEIHSGSIKKGYNTLKTSSIINPLCDDIQTFCGGCSYDVQKCQGKTGTNEWEELSDEAAKEKSAASAMGSMTPDAFGASERTVYAALQGCSLEKFLPGSDECWFCPLFRVLFNTASTVALKSYTVLANDAAMLVIVGFALWLSVFVLKHVAAVEVKQPGKMIQEMLLQAFKVLVVVLILKISFYQVMQLTLEPVFNTGLALTQVLTGKGTYNSDNPQQQLSCPDGAEYMQNIVGYDSDFNANSAGGLPRSMGKGIVCTIKSMQDSIGKMLAYGRQAWCVGWTTDKAFIKYVIPSFPFIFTGIMLMAGALLLLVSFPWCLIDCVVQMCIAAGLAPVAIGAWAFKATSRYLKMIWDFFMNAMFNFVFLSIIIYIIMTVVDQFMSTLDQHAGNTDDWDFLIHPINGLAYWGVTGLKLMVVCLLGWVFLDEGKSFADSYAKAADVGGIGRSVGGAFAQAGHKMSQVAGKVGKKAGKASSQMADHFVGSRIRQAQNKYRINKVKANGQAFTDANGNVVGYERTTRNLLGKKVTRTVTVGEDGKEVWSKTRQSYFGKGAVRITSGAAISKRERLDADGNVISESFKFKGNAGLYLTNKDGSINTNRVNDLIKNSGLSKEDVMKAVGTKIMEERGGTFDKYFKNRNVSFDDKGVMHMVQTNEDGSKVEFNMAIGGKGGNQMLTEFIRTEANGNYNVLYSNGVQNKTVSYNAGNANATVSYSFADEYHRRYRYTNPLNAQGRFDPGMDIDTAMYGFDQNDHALHTAQVSSGQKQSVGKDYTSKL